MPMNINSIVRLVLFTRPQCSLCDVAKTAVENVRSQQRLNYIEIDVLKHENLRWKNVYEFDTPVLHVQQSNDHLPTTLDVPREQKLFHRFNEQQIMDVVNKAERP